MDNGWKEINEGADMKIPGIYRFIIQYITPLILLAVFLGSLPDIWFKIQNPGNQYVLAARLLLLALYAVICSMVYLAYRRRLAGKRPASASH
jgi:putative exporter of polyketide antibiotics